MTDHASLVEDIQVKLEQRLKETRRRADRRAGEIAAHVWAKKLSELKLQLQGFVTAKISVLSIGTLAK